MTSTMDSGIHKLAVISILRVTADLFIDYKLLVFLGNRPSEILNPSLGSIGGHGTIGVTRVHKDSVLASDLRVDSNRAFATLGVAKITLFFAKVPVCHSLRDVKGIHNCAIIQIVVDWQSIDTVWNQL